MSHPPLSPSVGELDNRFNYHPPRNDEDRRAHDEVRAACHHAAVTVAKIVPPGREQSLALTKLEEAMFHANAGLARARGREAAEQQRPDRDAG